MLKARLIRITVCFLCSCLLVCSLQIYSAWKQSRPNGFIRMFPSNLLTGIGALDLKTGSWYFTGGDSNNVFLTDRTRPGIFVKSDSNRKNSSSFRVVGFENMGFYEGAYFRTESSNLYLLDGVKPSIAFGKFEERKLTTSSKVPYFTSCLPLSQKSSILRIVRNMSNCLVKFDDGSVKTLFKLEKQGDGIFSTDGSLIKADGSGQIFYIYNYRNEFISFDTDLKVKYKARTKDTITQSQIKVSRIPSENKITLSSPPLLVNKHCTANKSWLLIQSGIMADNETSEMTDNSSTVDVYNSKDGSYNFSFHISNYSGEKLSDFKLCGDYLYALYDHYLYKYKLNF